MTLSCLVALVALAAPADAADAKKSSATAVKPVAASAKAEPAKASSKSSGSTSKSSTSSAKKSGGSSTPKTAKKASSSATGSAAPVEPAAAPEPGAEAAPVSATESAAAPIGSPAPSELEALRGEIVALRGEVSALRAELAPPPPPAPEATPAVDPEKEARRASLHAELADVAAQREKLSAVVAGGVDPAFVASGLTLLDQRESDAIAGLAALDVAPPPEVVVVAASTPAKLAWTFDAGVSSAYAFRGLNTFQSKSQQDVAGLFAPSATLGLGDSGVSVGYWGGFQISGDNQAGLVDAGFGAEQDLFVTYGATVAENLKVGAAFTTYIYPFASEAVAGTASPLYLEPGASITWSPGVDLGLSVAYTFGVQDALAGARYVYVRPTLGKTVALPAKFALSAAVGGGFKGYGDGGPTDNVWDVSADLAVQKDFDGGFYLRPGAHAVWTNLEGKTVAESSFAWFGLNAGVVL